MVHKLNRGLNLTFPLFCDGLLRDLQAPKGMSPTYLERVGHAPLKGVQVPLDLDRCSEVVLFNQLGLEPAKIFTNN